MTDHNPHEICTLNEIPGCEECVIRGELNCRWDRAALLRFYLLNISSLVVAVTGMTLLGAMAGLWWMNTWKRTLL